VWSPRPIQPTIPHQRTTSLPASIRPRTTTPVPTVASGPIRAPLFKRRTATDVDTVGDHTAEVDVAVDLVVQDDIGRAPGGESGTDHTALSGDQFDCGSVGTDSGVGVDDDITED